MNREGDAGTGQGYGVRDRGFMGNEPVRLGGVGETQKQLWKCLCPPPHQDRANGRIESREGWEENRG